MSNDVALFLFLIWIAGLYPLAYNFTWKELHHRCFLVFPGLLFYSSLQTNNSNLQNISLNFRNQPVKKNINILKTPENVWIFCWMYFEEFRCFAPF